ncbi:hypothetical protein Acor_67390 [Acrocarpospora corrugata]|uniref:Uncharacterized protein n=1 Tax=Acrocarpospora corrugata TaxID=35763 RepID=A0A5M3WC69_9ACTN|nr:hypothetical protein [Acrocarpospora corrugata]GES04671.1 hypothetical protein Acor_67390 [Acrocarpospora corrugata]
MTNAPVLVEEKLTIYSPDQARREMTRLDQGYSDLAVLRDAIPSLLGVGIDEAAVQEPVGFGATWNLKEPYLAADAHEGDRAVKTIESSLICNSYNTGSEHVGVFATVMKPDVGDEKVDLFVLRTSDFIIEGVKEYIPDSTNHGRLAVRDGWWDALVGCLGRSCGGVCLSAALTCPKINWAAFLVCLAGRCGLCVVKCGACATCDCTWWCRPVVGCCNG